MKNDWHSQWSKLFLNLSSFSFKSLFALFQIDKLICTWVTLSYWQIVKGVYHFSSFFYYLYKSQFGYTPKGQSQSSKLVYFSSTSFHPIMITFSSSRNFPLFDKFWYQMIMDWYKGVKVKWSKQGKNWRKVNCKKKKKDEKKICKKDENWKEEEKKSFCQNKKESKTRLSLSILKAKMKREKQKKDENEWKKRTWKVMKNEKTIGTVWWRIRKKKNVWIWNGNDILKEVLTKMNKGKSGEKKMLIKTIDTKSIHFGLGMKNENYRQKNV